MNRPLTPYFDPDLLKVAFAADLAAVASSRRISEDQRRWLQTLVDDTDDQSQADTPRVDRLTSASSEFAGSELPEALLISRENNSEPQVYLYTLLNGLEPFDNRQSLLQYLEERNYSSSQALSELEAERLDSPVFESWTCAIVDVQVDAVNAVFQQIQALPTLRSAMTELLQNTVERSSPDVPLDIGWVCLQIAKQGTAADGSTTTEIVGTCSLLDAALDTYAGKALAADQSFVFLDGNGETLDAIWSKPYRDALSGVKDTLPRVFERTLQTWWRGPTTLRRDKAILALAESLRQSLLDNKANGNLTARQFADLRTLLPGRAARTDQGVTRISKLAAMFPGQEPIKLVGMFTVEFVDLQDKGVWLFSAETGLRRFDDRNALRVHVSTWAGRGFLFRHLSFNDHALATWSGWLDLAYESYDAHEGDLASSLVDGIIVFQQRNLNFALARGYRDRHEAQVMVDDALDVRRLLDSRLHARNDSGRWRESPRLFVPSSLDANAIHQSSTPEPSVAVAKQVVSPTSTSVDSVSKHEDTWVSQLQTLEADLLHVRTSRPGIEACARRLLNAQLCVFADGRFDARDMQLRLPVDKADEPHVSISLVDWLLARVSGARLVDIPVGTQVFVPSYVSASGYFNASMQRLTLNRLIKRAHGQFQESYLKQIREAHRSVVREGDRQTELGQLSCDIRMRQLRLELAVEKHLEKFGPDALDMLQQLLDRPAQSMRSALGNQRVQVSSVSIEHDPRQNAVVLTNVFVFHRPAHAEGPLVFWSAIKGLRMYSSLAQLTDHLNRWLRKPEQNVRLRALLSEQDAQLISVWLQQPASPGVRLQTQVIQTPFIEHLQRAEEHRQYLSIEAAYFFATRRKLDSKAFIAICRSAETQNVATATLDAFTLSLEYLLLSASFPDWLTKASNLDLTIYCELLDLYLRVGSPDQDFLFNIPQLKDFAKEMLVSQLAADFPGQRIEPDDILVKHLRYVTPGVMGANSPLGIAAATEAYEETLTDFVLNHLGADKSFSLSVSTTDPRSVISVLTAPYLNQLARKLDVGGNFQKVLEEKLSTQSPDYAERYARFCWQYPAQTLEMAFELKLQGVLSERAWWFVERVIEMPDGLARSPVQGVRVDLRPFALIAAPGMDADLATGMYLFGPDDPDQGPLVLQVIFHEDFCFKEYASEAALMADLHKDTGLQNLVLQRLSPQARARYDFGGFHGAHLPTGIIPPLELPADVPLPPTLSRALVKGNAKLFFFEDTLRAMKNLAKNQTVTTAQSDWASFTYLLTLTGEQVLTFLPGRLGMLVAAWHSQSWFKSSFSSATAERWGKAISEFGAGLAMLLSQRTAREEEAEALDLREIKGDELQESPEPEGGQALDFSWGNGELSADLKARLRAFEVNDIELQALQKDPLLNLYLGNTPNKLYASVGGKVFKVRQVGGSWRVVGDHTRASGPTLRLNTRQQWELDVKWGLVGGGPVISRIKASRADANVAEVFITQAQGMEEIRALSRDDARRIGQAHLHAKRYLENALDNLNFPDTSTALDSRAQTLIKDFFEVTTVNPALHLELQNSAKALFDQVLDASLSPWSSERFVVGINKPGFEYTLGFTVKADPKRRIFLTERFFHAPAFSLASTAQTEGFEAGAHYRATILIHELSHLALNTQDIAYVESTAPFVDLLQGSTLNGALIKAGITDIRGMSLSHRTPRNRLFQVLKNGVWSDLSEEDGKALKTILDTTKAMDLEEARDTFLADEQIRWKLIMKNADSVSLLMTLLGRTRFS
ncbi:dermonecrotic toxin domain-containing protein [Pseudomonas huanghezhanensis]|uniref:dermonecrotic toxin domain-containing protein n=1 Tax=Pseudomonas huanghezhanensis TaxID=3002903 RepID=UPI0022867109|nr:DUF6543 domain-containing protein [Pseudomonas sp. BSw22131]